MWNNLPLDVQKLILREKHLLESEEMRPIFGEVLLELLEYSFATGGKSQTKYRWKLTPNESITISPYKTSFICSECNNYIYSYTSNHSDIYTGDVYAYKTLNGKYSCCYRMKDLFSEQEVVAIPASAYYLDHLINSFFVHSKKEMGIREICSETAKMVDIPSKYTPLRCKNLKSEIILGAH